MERPCHRNDDDEQRRQKDAALIPAAAFEAEYERDEIKGKREDPQKRNRRDIVRDVVRHAEQHEGAHCGQQQPHHVVAHARRRPAVGGHGARAGGCSRIRAPDTVYRRGRAQEHEGGIARCPSVRLLRPRNPRFDGKRIGDQCEKGAEIRKREEPVHRSCGIGTCKPRLHERPGGGQQEIG